MNQRPTIFLSIVLGLLLTGIWLYIIDFGEMLNIVKEVRLSFVLPLILLFISAYFLRSLRWRIILSSVEEITVVESFNLCMTNYFINFLVPVHAGEVAKSLLLKKMKGTPISKSLLTVYIDKATDFLPIFLLLAVAPFLQKRLSYMIYLASGILFLIVSASILMLSLVAYRKSVTLTWTERILFFLPTKHKERVTNFLDLFGEGVSSVTSLSSRLLEMSGLTVLAVLVHCAVMWLFFYSFGIELPVLTVLVGYLLLNVCFLLPAPPGFAGSLELSFVFIFTYLYGYDENLVSAVAASSHIFTAVLFGVLGLSSMAFIGTKLSTLIGMESKSRTGSEELQVSGQHAS